MTWGFWLTPCWRGYRLKLGGAIAAGRGFIFPLRPRVPLSGTDLPADFVKDTVHKSQGRECDEIVSSPCWRSSATSRSDGALLMTRPWSMRRLPTCLGRIGLDHDSRLINDRHVGQQVKALNCPIPLDSPESCFQALAVCRLPDGQGLVYTAFRTWLYRT